ncbi:MAG: hypothetical protein CML67_06640 [Rhodobacteraceae bacterium]|nr:hypothetical protein [Paracoccaceae bacterium]
MADRKLPTSTSMPPVSGADYMDQVAEKVGMLFDAAALRPVSLTNAGNDYTMEVEPALDGDVVAGMAFYLQPEVGNTGPVRLREGANPFYDLTRADGSPLAPGDFSAGTVYFVVFVAGAFMIVSGGTGGGAMIDYQVFEASGTWIKPTGLSDDALIFVEAWGGGGGGNASTNYRGGGGGGAYLSRWMRGGDVGNTEVVQVGAGGTASGNPGGPGGNSSFGSHLTAYGGGGGGGANSVGQVGGGGGGGGWGSAGSTGSVDNPGLAGAIHSNLFGGGQGGNASSGSTNPGAATGFGGGGGGASGGPGYGNGGASLFGGAGGDSGQVGAPRGGGGGGGASGGRGEVVVRVIDKRGGAAGGNDFAMPDGTAAEPGLPFLADPDTGFVRTDDDEMGLVAGGLIGFRQSSTQSMFLAGSAAAPSMTFWGDRDTGFFSPAADQIAAAVGGSEIWRTTAAGLAVGKTSAAFPLDVEGDAAVNGNINLGRAAIIRSAADFARGNVIISAPNDVTTRQVSYGNNLYIDDAGVYQQDSTIIGGAMLLMSAPNGGSGEFKFVAKQDPDAGGTESVRALIDGSGRLVIGGTSGSYLLDVYGDIRARDRLLIGAGAGTAYGNDNLLRPASSSAFLNIKGGAGRAKIVIGNDDNTIVSGSGATVFRYGAGATDGGTEAMRIDSLGRVGINTSSPSYQFEVNGALASLASTAQVVALSGDLTNHAFIRFRQTASESRIESGSGGSYGAVPMTFLVAGAEAARFDVTGNLLIGTATTGASKLRIVDLPTSATGLSAGDIWNDAGTLKVAA